MKFLKHWLEIIYVFTAIITAFSLTVGLLCLGSILIERGHYITGPIIVFLVFSFFLSLITYK